ncbi:MAG: class C sortase [Lachnospiraceae bacterium]|nr:class C sortase [Lachnospiraceae bacterium]
MKKGTGSTLVLILVLILGLSLLLYPTFSDYWNSFHQSKAVAVYTEQVAKLDDEHYSVVWNRALLYNTELSAREIHYVLSEEQLEEYNQQLNLENNGVMGYISIPKIDVELPVYHGTDEAVLQIAVGHLEWSSLPAGGESSHCVLSGHRGLPSAKLFTNLDELVVGDTFLLHVLDEVLTYEVDQILIVEPSDLSALDIIDGQDLCTLITCTPYGINSHRLLVRGHRIDTVEESNVRVTADAMQIDPLMVAPVVAAPILLILLAAVLVQGRKRK